MVKLTSELKRKIGEDWLTVLPDMGLYERMSFRRRVGPLLIGVKLWFDDVSYRPYFHVSCLRTRSGTFSFDLSSPLRMTPGSGEKIIWARWHEHHWKAAAEVMINTALVPLSGDVHLERVEAAYLNYMERSASEREDLTNYESLIILCGWCGQSEKALHYLQLASDIVASWPERERNFKETHSGFDFENWHNQYSTLAVSPEAVQAIIAEQVALDKNLQKLPVAQLLS